MQSSFNSSYGKTSGGSVRKSSNSPVGNDPRRTKIIIASESISQVKIDGYRQSLKENGFAEIDIPSELQTKIDAVNKILKGNQRNHKIDNTRRAYVEYLTSVGEHLSENDKNSIKTLILNFGSFITKTLNEICFVDTKKSFEVFEFIDLNIRFTDDTEHVFHKDQMKIKNYSTKSNIGVVYPMLGQKGTAYIPFSKKKETLN